MVKSLILCLSITSFLNAVNAYIGSKSILSIINFALSVILCILAVIYCIRKK